MWFKKHITCPFCRQENTVHAFSKEHQEKEATKNPYIINIVSHKNLLNKTSSVPNKN